MQSHRLSHAKPSSIHKGPLRQMQTAVRALNVCFRFSCSSADSCWDERKGKPSRFRIEEQDCFFYGSRIEGVESKARTSAVFGLRRCSRIVDRADADRKAKEARDSVKTPGTPFLSSTCMLFPFVADIISSSEQPIKSRFPSWPPLSQSAAFHSPCWG